MIIPVKPNTIKCVLGKAIGTKINALSQEVGYGNHAGQEKSFRLCLTCSKKIGFFIILTKASENFQAL
jgi:hypothetical protein